MGPGRGEGALRWAGAAGVGGGGEAGEAAEYGGEVLGTGETETVGEGGDANIGVAEFGAGGGELGAKDVLAGRQADLLTKAGLEPRLGKVNGAGELGHV